MKLGKWTLAIAAVALILGGTAMAVDANRICINNGSDYYIIGYDHNYLNCGGGKYFPSYAHVNATEDCSTGICYYPWKLQGWAWAGMQAGLYGPDWHWTTALQKSLDAPYSTQMTFAYPFNYFTGANVHSGAPNNVYGGTTPSSIYALSSVPSSLSAVGVGMTFPSSAGGFDSYMNIIAAGEADWSIPSTQAYYGWLFAFTYPGASPLLLHSSYSVWEYVWENTGNPVNGQYLLLDGNSMDCTGTLGGNKGKNYTLIGGMSGGYYGYWNNACTGTDSEWSMCLFVKDAVVVPTNVNNNGSGPYASYGFDVGSATVTPNGTSGLFTLQAVYESYEQPGKSYWLLACLPQLSSPITYGPFHYRVSGWDFITNIFSTLPFWMGTVAPGYPACMFGSTVGGHSIAIPAGPQPAIGGTVLTWYGFSTTGQPPTAGFTTTFF